MTLDKQEPKYKFPDSVVNRIKEIVQQNIAVSDTSRNVFVRAVDKAKDAVTVRHAKRHGEFATLAEAALMQMGEDGHRKEVDDLYNNTRMDFHYINQNTWEAAMNAADEWKEWPVDTGPLPPDLEK